MVQYIPSENVFMRLLLSVHFSPSSNVIDEIPSFTHLFCVCYSKNKTAFWERKAFALILTPRSLVFGKDKFSRFLSALGFFGCFYFFMNS